MNIEHKRRLEKIEDELKAALPERAGDAWLSEAFSGLPEGVTGENALALIEPCRRLLMLGGKRWRPLLLVLACELAGSSPEAAYPIAPAVELLHTASLIHDDIEDSSLERRGKPCAHVVYGIDAAINSASWLYFHAQTCVASYNADVNLKLSLFSIINRDIRRLHLGQAMDIQWHREPAFIPSRKQYEAMIRLKTGTLASLAAELGSVAGGAKEDETIALTKLACEAGAAFQILDDVKNLIKGNPGKKRGDDIVEGKKSLPVVIHHEMGGENLNALFEKAKKEGIDSPAVEEAITALESSGALTKAEEYGKQLGASCIEGVKARWHGNHAAEQIIELFATLLG